MAENSEFTFIDEDIRNMLVVVVVTPLMVLGILSIVLGAVLFILYKIGEVVERRQEEHKLGPLAHYKFVDMLTAPMKKFDDFVSYLRRKYPLAHEGVKWALPLGMTGLGQFFMQVCLHCATYFYIISMDTLVHEVKTTQGDNVNYLTDLSMGWSITNGTKPFGSLEDPVARLVPYFSVNINTLDLVAGALMMVFVVLCFFQNDKKLWTKVFVCHALLAVCKGIIDVTTIEPDSSGWENCQERLGGQPVVDMFKKKFNPFTDGYFYFFMEVALFEMFGFQMDRITSGVRYCSDMMLSGHTFVTCLYALGTCELLQRIRQNPPRNVCVKHFIDTWGLVLYIVFVVFIICEQLLEISLVLSDRFHYTADVVVAIIATLALYTNGPLAIYAEWWASSFGEFDADELEGNIWVPPCCIPFCDPHGDCLGLQNGYHKLKWVDAATDAATWLVEQERVQKFGWKVEKCSLARKDCKNGNGSGREGVIVNVRKSTECSPKVKPDQMNMECNQEPLLEDKSLQFEYQVIHWKKGGDPTSSDALWVVGKYDNGNLELRSRHKSRDEIGKCSKPTKPMLESLEKLLKKTKEDKKILEDFCKGQPSKVTALLERLSSKLTETQE